jgi:hypothetical protein
MAHTLTLIRCVAVLVTGKCVAIVCTTAHHSANLKHGEGVPQRRCGCSEPHTPGFSNSARC